MFAFQRVLFVSFSLLTLGSAHAQTPPQPAALETFLAERVSVWQERLNLREWNISVIPTRREEMKTGTLGRIRWDKPRKTAVISILDPADYKLSRNEMMKDIEFTIVHELIHLELASLPRSEASRSTEEHAVNNIARALLSGIAGPN